MASRSPVDRHAPPSSVGDLKLEILEIPLRALSSFRRLNALFDQFHRPEDALRLLLAGCWKRL